MKKQMKFVLGGMAVLLSLAVAPGAFARPIDEDPIDLPVEEPIYEGPVDPGGEGGIPTLPPSGPFNPPPRPFPLFAPNLYVHGQLGSPLYQSCGQTAHAYLPFVYDMTRGTTLYPSGVVPAGSRIHFGFFTPAGQLVKTHLTQPARANCVVHHEPEAMSTADLVPGYYFVYASYWILTNNGFVATLAGYPISRAGDYVTVIRIQ